MDLLDHILTVAKAQRLTQKELARKAGIPEESLSRLKGRKSIKTHSLELLANAVDLELVLKPRVKPPVPFREKYKYLAWSNSKASDEILLRQALILPDFSILLDAAVEFGVAALQEQWELLLASDDPDVKRVEHITSRMLRHIVIGAEGHILKQPDSEILRVAN